MRTLDEEAARAARAEAGIIDDGADGSQDAAAADGTSDGAVGGTPGKARGPKDSGKGVRVMVRPPAPQKCRASWELCHACVHV